MQDKRKLTKNIDLGAAAYIIAAAVIACFLYYVRHMVLADHDSLFEFVLARKYDFKYAYDRALNFNLKRGRVGVIFPFVVALRYQINGTGNYVAVWLLQYIPIIANIALIAHIIRKVFSRGFAALFVILFAGLVQINRWHCLIICYPLDFMYGLFVMILGLWTYYQYLTDHKKTGISHYGKLILSAFLTYESFMAYEPFFVSCGVYALITFYFAIREEKKLSSRILYLIKKLWPVVIAALLFLVLYSLHLNSEFVDESPSYPTGDNLHNMLYTWGVISGGMFPLIYFFYPADSRELIGASFAPGVFKMIIAALTMAGAYIALKSVSKDKEKKTSAYMLFAVLGAFIGLFFALPHSLTVLYQNWVVNDHQAGYVPTCICYFGWIVMLSSVAVLIFTKVKKGREVICILFAVAIGVGSYITYSVNDGFRNIPYGQSEAECLKDQALYSLFISDAFREEKIDLLYTPQYMGIHNATETNEELAEYESGNVLDLTKYGDEFEALFDQYEHPARFEYNYETYEGTLYVYDDDGDHEADREITIAIGN